jgi:6-phosphogluconolactonase
MPMIFLGTYTRDGASKGIYATRLNAETGELNPPTLVAEAVDPAWVTLSPNQRFLYAIHGSPAQAIAFRIDRDTPKLTPLAAEPSATANPPSHRCDRTGSPYRQLSRRLCGFPRDSSRWDTGRT